MSDFVFFVKLHNSTSIQLAWSVVFGGNPPWVSWFLLSLCGVCIWKE
jgi:hypothetical protein